MASFTDGVVLPKTGFGTLESGTYLNKVPIILGTNKEERKFSLFFREAFSDDASRNDEELYKNIAVFGSDLWKASGVDGLLRRFRANANQPDVYGYQFCWGARRTDGKNPLPEPYATMLGACHAMDIPFFFDLTRTFGPIDKEIFNEKNKSGKEALTRSIMTYVAQFIRTGDPNKPGSEFTKTRWEPWSNKVGGSKCIIFDVDGDIPDIRMTSEELTEKGVRARLEVLPEPLRTRVKKSIAGGLL
jgi:para-nitrobenzyl esterase